MLRDRRAEGRLSDWARTENDGGFYYRNESYVSGRIIRGKHSLEN